MSHAYPKKITSGAGPKATPRLGTPTLRVAQAAAPAPKRRTAQTQKGGPKVCS